MITETAPPTLTRSAGKSRKGAGKYNWDYLCQVEYPAGSRIRGLYAVADGSSSPSRGDLASELAVETLKDYFQHYRDGQAEGASETSNLLKLCFSEINASLLKHRIARKEGEEEAYPMYSTLTAGYQIGNTFHIGHTGSGAVYMIADGKIQRLTEEHTTELPAEDSSGSEGAFAPGLLGWKEQGCLAGFHTIPIEGNTVLIFCTNGVTAHLSSLALLEAWLETRSPEGMAERVLGRLEGRGAAEDASVVVFQAEAQHESAGKFVRPIRYPAHVALKKHFLVLVLLAILSALVAHREVVVNRLGTRSPAAATAEKLETGGPAATPSAAPAEPAAPEPELVLTTDPADAAVFVDGTQLRGTSPHRLRTPAGKPVSLRVEREGYIPFATTVDGAGARRGGLNIRLNRKQAEYGSIKIHCKDTCAEILIDGVSVKAAFPRNFLHHIGVKPGLHEVKARSGEHTLAKKVKVGPGKAAELRFEFPAAEPPAPGPALVEASRSRPEAPEARPNPPPLPAPVTSPPDRAEAPPPAPAKQSEQISRVFFTVKTDVPGCSLMVFRGGQLVLTGMSGERMDLPPGEYLIEAARDGYGPVVKKINLSRRFQIVEMRLR